MPITQTSVRFGTWHQMAEAPKSTGHYLIAGPDWKGTLPKGVNLPAPADGVKAVGAKPASPTNNVFVFGRTAVHGPDDIAAVNKLQDQYKLTPLSLWGKKDIKLPPADHNVPKPYDKKTLRRQDSVGWM